MLSYRNLSSICRALFWDMLKLFRNSICMVVQQGILPYRNGSMFWRSRSQWLKIGAIFLMIIFFTSYSKDKREKEAKYWSLSQKIKGQPFCNSLIALYFWRNIFTPLNHRCIQLKKQMTDDDWNIPRTSKVKKVIDQGQ